MKRHINRGGCHLNLLYFTRSVPISMKALSLHNRPTHQLILIWERGVILRGLRAKVSWISTKWDNQMKFVLWIFFICCCFFCLFFFFYTILIVLKLKLDKYCLIYKMYKLRITVHLLLLIESGCYLKST